MQRTFGLFCSALMLCTTLLAQAEALPATGVVPAPALQAPPAEAITQTPAQAAAQAAWEAKNRPASGDPEASNALPAVEAPGAASTATAATVAASATTTASPTPNDAATSTASPASNDVSTQAAGTAGAADSAAGAAPVAAGAADVAVTSTDTAPEAALQDVTQQLAVLEKDLSILEEDLLYPPSSRIAVYMSMDVGELFALDEVEVKINGTTVAHHLYTEQQVDALHRGGVQRLYVGNAKQGDNEVTAFFLGRGHNKEALRRAATATFAKTFEPAYIELKIIDSEVRQRPDLKVEVH